MSSFITCEQSQSSPWAEHFFWTKLKMAAKRHVEVLIPELFDIYFNVIPNFHMIFNAECISQAISSFKGFVEE